MWRKHWVSVSVVMGVVAAGVIGCGKSTPQTKAVPQPGPEAAVAEFLEAVRSGDDVKTTQMLTAAARETTGSLGIPLTPTGSDTAEFKVGEVKYLSDDGARVSCTLSDLDENAQRQEQKLDWMVRREPEGWRIAGVAAVVVEGEPPRALNFESREEMQQLSQAVHGTDPQAQRPANPGEPTRR